MTNEELERALEFMLEHRDIRIETASDLERWKEIAPPCLHDLFERLLAFKTMSLREMIDHLTASSERLRELAKEIEGLTG